VDEHIANLRYKIKSFNTSSIFHRQNSQKSEFVLTCYLHPPPDKATQFSNFPKISQLSLSQSKMSSSGGPSNAKGSSNKNQEVLDQIKQLSQAIQSAKQNQIARPPPSIQQSFGSRGGPRTRYQPYSLRPQSVMLSRRPPASTLSKNQTLVVKPSAEASSSSDVKADEPMKVEDKGASYVSRGNTLTRVGARKSLDLLIFQSNYRNSFIEGRNDAK
jgi:hypothetical protein